MANTFTRYVSKDIGTTAATILTVAAATTTTVIGLTVANTSASAITVDVFITISAVNYYIVKGAMVAAGGTLVAVGGDQKVNMITGDILKVQSSTATSCDAIVSVLNIT